jgi:hypothetical protein
MTVPRKKSVKPPAPKTEFLQIRLSVQDRKRVAKAASAEYLDASTWARQTILKAIYDFETKDRTPRLRVAEPEPAPPGRSRNE